MSQCPNCGGTYSGYELCHDCDTSIEVMKHQQAEIKELEKERDELTERRKETISMCDQLMTENTNLRDKQKDMVSVPKHIMYDWRKLLASTSPDDAVKRLLTEIKVMIAKAKEE